MKTSIIQVFQAIEVERTSRERENENIYYTSILTTGSRKELAERGKVKTSIMQVS